MQCWCVGFQSRSSSIGYTRAIVALAKSDAHRYQAPRVPRRPRPSITGTLLHVQVHEGRLRRVHPIPRASTACAWPKLMRQAGRTAAAEFTNPSNHLTAVDAAPRRGPNRPLGPLPPANGVARQHKEPQSDVWDPLQ